MSAKSLWLDSVSDVQIRNVLIIDLKFMTYAIYTTTITPITMMMNPIHFGFFHITIMTMNGHQKGNRSFMHSRCLKLYLLDVMTRVNPVLKYAIFKRLLFNCRDAMSIRSRAKCYRLIGLFPQAHVVYLDGEVELEGNSCSDVRRTFEEVTCMVFLPTSSVR